MPGKHKPDHHAGDFMIRQFAPIAVGRIHVHLQHIVLPAAGLTALLDALADQFLKASARHVPFAKSLGILEGVADGGRRQSILQRVVEFGELLG